MTKIADEIVCDGVIIFCIFSQRTFHKGIKRGSFMPCLFQTHHFGQSHKEIHQIIDESIPSHHMLYCTLFQRP